MWRVDCNYLITRRTVWVCSGVDGCEVIAPHGRANEKTSVFMALRGRRRRHQRLGVCDEVLVGWMDGWR